MDSKSEWYLFQEELSNHFNNLGARARTNIAVQGVRTSHDIDVLVELKYFGQSVTWIVEAKHWKNKVNKLHILALREIVNDIGADRGFIISKSGFQSGAIEAAEKTNITLSNFEDFIKETEQYVQREIIKSYKDRLRILEIRYFSHSKIIRKKYNLRGELFEQPAKYSGANIILIAHNALNLSMQNIYPIDLDTHIQERKGKLKVENFQELINWLNLNLNYLDEKILKAENKMIENGDFNPDFSKLIGLSINELPFASMIHHGFLLSKSGLKDKGNLKKEK